jgi:hypothetical protein
MKASTCLCAVAHRFFCVAPYGHWHNAYPTQYATTTPQVSVIYRIYIAPFKHQEHVLTQKVLLCVAETIHRGRDVITYDQLLTEVDKEPPVHDL